MPSRKKFRRSLPRYHVPGKREPPVRLVWRGGREFQRRLQLIGREAFPARSAAFQAPASFLDSRVNVSVDRHREAAAQPGMSFPFLWRAKKARTKRKQRLSSLSSARISPLRLHLDTRACCQTKKTDRKSTRL